MKQILLTIENPIGSQLEAKEFLTVCKHSPEWIGDPEQWEIRSFQYHKNKNDRTCVTALLENKNWNVPEYVALTAIQLYEQLKSVPRDYSVAFGVLKGINEHIESYDFGVINTDIEDCDVIIKTDKQNAKPYVILNTLLEKLDLSDDGTLDFSDEDDVSIEDDVSNAILNIVVSDNRAKHEKSLYYDCYPITEIKVDSDDKKVILIFNRDIKKD